MAELLAETTAMHVPGFPQFLREIWGHLYPDSPLPIYHLYQNRLDRATTEFYATVRLRPQPLSTGVEHGLTSGVCTQASRAIQEAAGDAILFLRTVDPVMRQCTRYIYFPRLAVDNGDTLFPNPGDTSSPLYALIQYTTHLHQYLHTTLLQFASLRANVALAEMTRASGHPSRLPTFRLGSLELMRRGLARRSTSPAPTPPPRTRSATYFYSHTSPVRSQRRRVQAASPPPSGDPRDDRASPDYSPAEEPLDTTTPATPLEMEF